MLCAVFARRRPRILRKPTREIVLIRKSDGFRRRFDVVAAGKLVFSQNETVIFDEASDRFARFGAEKRCTIRRIKMNGFGYLVDCELVLVVVADIFRYAVNVRVFRRTAGRIGAQIEKQLKQDRAPTVVGGIVVCSIL